MTRVRSRGEKIRRFILSRVTANPSDIARLVSEEFGVSRQAANKHIRNLVQEGVLVQEGKTRRRTYQLAAIEEWSERFQSPGTLAEDVLWRENVAPRLGDLPDNVREIWNYGFSEMMNNVIDHSGAEEVLIVVKKTATTSEMIVSDNGIGIFRKLQTELGLLDERHAILELSKGKVTTDPKNHTGEGIFFTSRMFDDFQILSGGTAFSHEFGRDEDYILERKRYASGTAVFMVLNNHTSRTTAKIFNRYTSEEDFGFTKTVVPVRLAQYGSEALVSRSQAKRLMARVDRFKTVVLDFSEVDDIGRAFADEIFRVFRFAHPEVDVVEINANSSIQLRIALAKLTAVDQSRSSE